MKTSKKLLLAALLVLQPGTMNVIAQQRIAVLPFKNISGDKQFDWLADGFCETLTSAFAQIGRFIVVERSQIERIMQEQDFQMTDYADESKVVEIGKILGVEKMVIGSFQVFAGNINVSTRVVDVRTGQVDRQGALANKKAKLEQLFDLQEEICIFQAKAFGGEISKQDEDKVAAITVGKSNTLSAYEYYIKGRDQYFAKNYTQAISYFQDAISANPKYSEAFNYLGLVYDKQGLYERAIENYEKALEYNPKDAVVANNLGIVYGVLKDYEKGKSFSLKSIELNPNYYNAYNNLGWIAETLGDKDEAIRHFLKSYALDPSNAYAAKHLGSLYLGKEQNSDAVFYYEKAVANDPNDASSYYDLGVGYWRLSRWADVVDAWEKCLGINKSHKEAGEWLPKAREKLAASGSTRELDDYGRGLEYFNSKNYEKAIESFESEVKSNKRNSSAWGYLGLSYSNNGDDKEALRCYKKSIAIKPTDWVTYNTGVLYWKTQEWEKVIDSWEQCLSINPQYKEALEWLPKARQKLEGSGK